MGGPPVPGVVRPGVEWDCQEGEDEIEKKTYIKGGGAIISTRPKRQDS
jgi:hypothetical protein